MPHGKELEQLPMSHILPGAGDDQSDKNRISLKGMIPLDQTKPKKKQP